MLEDLREAGRDCHPGGGFVFFFVFFGVCRPRPSTSRAASTTPVSTIRAPWKQVRDSGTGIRFALPRSVKPVAKRVTAKDGTPVYQRVYAVAITPTFALSVAIVHSHQTYSAAALDGVANGLVAQLRAGGIKDAQVLERKQVRLGKLAALDFRLRFTPLDKTKGKSIWFVRVVADNSVLVLLQSIASPPPGATTLLATARAAQHKLVAGLRFP